MFSIQTLRGAIADHSQKVNIYLVTDQQESEAGAPSTRYEVKLASGSSDQPNLKYLGSFDNTVFRPADEQVDYLDEFCDRINAAGENLQFHPNEHHDPIEF